MSSNSDRDARMRDAEQGGGPRDKDWLAGRIAARSGPEVTVSGMPCEAVSGDAVRREVVSALRDGDARPVERVVFLTIGGAHPDSRGDSQALIDKDVDVLDDTVWRSPHTIRYAMNEMGYGFDAIHRHRVNLRGI